MPTHPNPQHPAYQLLARAHSPTTAATLFVDKVLHKPLILRPTSPDPTSQDARAARRAKRIRTKQHAAKKQKPKRLSAKEKRQLGVYDIPKEDRRYDLFVPLHHLWLGYMREILGLTGPQAATRTLTPAGAGPMIASADYHGALLEVVRCRCPDRVGVGGIVVKDSKFTFELITKENVIKTIPKEHTIFRFEVSLPTEEATAAEGTGPSGTEDGHRSHVFELNGMHIQNRAVDRANKKFRPRKVED